eukprot:TRINITY_DN1959_c0_g2_i1.p1 TRINITY_DN1959_c0_g2~~TRINITY_DN1959_c0_g2_i1.p1  ORF type:complete len:205 (+),score=44.00 TRINITY_DN1959_c0_g2_i1:119-733(+)
MVSLGQFSKEEIDAFDGLYEDNSIVEFNFCRRDGVNVELTRTKYCQLNVFFLCTTEYPSDMLLIELQSQTIEEELLEKLKKLVCKKLKTLKNQHQIKTALDMFISIMTNNLFLHCKSEIDDIKSLLILTKEKLKNAKKNEEEQQEEEQPEIYFCNMSPPVNIYQRGIIKNFGEVFFPFYKRKIEDQKKMQNILNNQSKHNKKKL